MTVSSRNDERSGPGSETALARSGQKAWRVRPFRHGDEERLLELLRRSFRDEPADRFAIDYWRWEYLDGDGGSSSVLLADDGGTIVGHYAASPHRFVVDGVPHTGAIVTDVVTHADYRFQGMFTALGRSAMDSVASDRIEFCFGFPIRPEVMPGHLKVGWSHAFDLPVLAFPLRFGAILHEFSGRRFVGRVLGPIGAAAFRVVIQPLARLRRVGMTRQYLGTVSEIGASDHRLTDLWERVARQHRIAAVRDVRYLEWRFARHPRKQYRLLAAEQDGAIDGYVVVSRDEIMGLDAGVIVDLLVDKQQPGALKELIEESIQSFAAEGADLVAIMVDRRTVEYDQLRSLGFLRTPHEFHFILFQNGTSIPVATLLDEDAWWLTWGDTDVL